MYTPDEVMTYIEEENVRFVRLSFCDISGTQKNLTIMPDGLRDAFENGVSIDSSAIRGFGDVVSSDLFLRPDASTLSAVPWHPAHGKMVRMYCNVYNPDGSVFERDGRHILRKAVNAAAECGINCAFGSEFEFYLFRTDENGNRTKVPFDHAGYMDIDSGDKCEQIRREICFTLLDMGIKPECAHHEEGPGQNEIDFRYSDPLTTADNAVTFKSVVRTVASRNGLYASFTPKPLGDKSGSGMHINISVSSNSGADCTDSFLAGILAHVREMTILLNPTEESYTRLGKMKAPKYISWSRENRSQLVRIPASTTGNRRIELRSPDAGANPYAAFAALIYAGLDGIKRGIPLPPPVNANLLEKGSEAKGLRTLPLSRDEAARIALESEFLGGILPEGYIEALI